MEGNIMHMIANVPQPVFAFLYLMWGGVKHKYMTFLTPKYAQCRGILKHLISKLTQFTKKIESNH